MFGFDEWIAHASDGTTLVLVLAVAVLLGLRHATDPDHLVAVATLIAADQSPAARQAGRLGASWGLGHATSLLGLGLPIVLLGASVPERLEQAAESAIGLTIAALAAWLLVRWRRGLLHVDAGPAPTRRRSHMAGDAHAHRRAPARTPQQAYAIGFLHGVGGSAGVAVLLLAGVGNDALAVLALALFALCTAISMALLSTGFGVTLGTAPARQLFGRLVPILGVGSLAFGTWYALAALAAVL
jgi:high-affinity nickel permease